MFFPFTGAGAVFRQEIIKFRFEFNEEDSTAIRDTVVEKRRWWQRRIKRDTAQNKPAREFVIDE